MNSQSELGLAGKKRLFHIVGLDTLGGVEALYSHFISSTRDLFEHTTMNDRDSLSASISLSVIQSSVAFYYTKRLGFIPIPKKPESLRAAYLNHCIRKERPDTVVVWNKVEGFDFSKLSDDVEIVYYEHGAGWYSPRPELATQFLSRVDKVICNSAAAEKVLKARWALPGKTNVSICPNGIRDKCLPAVSPSPRLLPEKRAVLGIACRMVGRKGVPLVLHMLKILLESGCDVSLKVAGQGEMLAVYEQLAVDLELKDRVEFLGFVEDMSEFYTGIDIFLCPSITEPFVLVAAEAAAHGIPSVVSGVDGLQEVILDQVMGEVSPPVLSMTEYVALGGTVESLLDVTFHGGKVAAPMAAAPADLAARVCALLSDPKRYNDYSKACIREAYGRLSGQSYLQCLAELLLA